jgi:DNA-binding CsgD family transcriptional regulator
MNNKTTTMDPRSERMLELLAEGASARVIAKKLGYSEGTMRVYLHNLYRLIGVKNKTEAVIWHMHRSRSAVAPSLPRPAPMASTEPAIPADRLGDMALVEDLYTALGIMSSFVGPYGHLWEAGLRLKGTDIDDKLAAQRCRSRLLWRALLKGDFAYAKLLHDEGHADRVAAENPTDAAMLACALAIGGYSAAAGRLVSSVGDKRRAGSVPAAREVALMRAVVQATEGRGESAIQPLHAIAGEKGRASAVKQIAIAALFQVYRVRKHADAARRTADTLWSEAQAAREQLEAMGVRALPQEATLPPLASLRETTAAMPSGKAALVR